MNNGYQILREQNKYCILLEKSNESLIKSITKPKIILGPTITNNYTVISFHANNIQTWKEYTKEGQVSYNIFMRLIYYLSTQLKYLIETCNKTFMGYSPEHIIVINNERFIYLHVNQLHSIHNEFIDLKYPFSPDEFYMSPEHHSIKEIPATIHYKACYFSLACFIIHGYYNQKHDLKDVNNINNINNITHKLEILPIKDTKLYYLLKRCISEDLTNRCILFI
jgi:hypothetical protein